MLRAVAVTSLVCGALVAPAASQAAPKCKHLLVDPRGDVSRNLPTSSFVPDSELDVVYADLRTTKREVVGTIGLDDLLDESASLTDRVYEVGFTTNGERYELSFIGAKPNNTAYAWHVLAGDDNPEQNRNGTGAQVGERVGIALGFTVDRRENKVTVRFDRAIFAKYGGIGRTLTNVSAMSWWGNGVKPTPDSESAGTYVGGDFGYTKTTYRDGAASCVA